MVFYNYKEKHHMMLQKILIMMMLSNISVNYDVFYERILYKYFLMLKVKKTKKK